MDEQDPIKKVQNALGHSANQGDEEETKEAALSSKNLVMEQSFYRKQGIDFLSF